jgi:hypothetical protein
LFPCSFTSLSDHNDPNNDTNDTPKKPQHMNGLEENAPGLRINVGSTFAPSMSTDDTPLTVNVRPSLSMTE